jgi:DNA polymerase-3 subunit epsilon
LRQIVLDTETTGLDPEQGHRIIEIGCIELENRRLTGRHFHRYLNPEREIEAGAIAVHGIRNEDLADKPRFAEIAEELLAFLNGAELVIHNAPFDVGFLEHELRSMGHAVCRLDGPCRILDTLSLSRKMHPGQRHSLDALCKRYEVDNSQRDLHGALLDARLLADVYLAMTGGQGALSLDTDREASAAAAGTPVVVDRDGARLRVIEATADERQAHEALLALIDEASGGRCLWRTM